MRTLSCTLKFTDGKLLRVQASAQSPDQAVAYSFAGDTSRLRPFADRGTLGFLKWYLQGCAATHGAETEISSEGDYSDVSRD
jgi:hypothetical protein